MEGEKRPRGLAVLVGCLAVALVAVLGLNLFLLWGRGAAVASLNGSGAAVPDSGQNSMQSVSNTVLPPAEKNLPAWVEEWGFVTELPAGSYAPIEEESFGELKGDGNDYISWLYPIIEGEEEEVIQFCFYTNGTISISRGYLQSDAGRFYTGEYTYLGDGLFSASVYTYEEIGENVPPSDYVDITVLVEWPPKGFDCAVITLVQYEAKEKNSNFPMVFDDMVGKQLPFTRF